MDERLKHAVSGAAYARRHPHKYVVRPASAGTQTEQLPDWGAMQVNVGKTIVSGITQTDTRLAA
jgi:hypothetical protein